MATISSQQAEQIYAGIENEYRAYKSAVENAETPEQEEAAWQEWQGVQERAFAAHGLSLGDLTVTVDD